MQWTDDVRIETPEQIDVSLEIAGLGSRFVAWVVDGLIKVLALTVLGVLVLLLAALLEFNPANRGMMTYVGILAIILIFFLAFGYHVYFEVRHNGQSPGKKTAGIRVIREWGGPVDFRAACIRNFLAIADFLPGFYLLGGLLVLLSTRSQRLGDMAAGTIVIRERSVDAPDKPLKLAVQFISEEFVFTANHLSACLPGDRHILKAFFQRYRGMDKKARCQLARRLAGEFVRKTAYQPLAPLDEESRAEQFLASLYRDLEKVAQQRG